MFDNSFDIENGEVDTVKNLEQCGNPVSRKDDRKRRGSQLEKAHVSVLQRALFLGATHISAHIDGCWELCWLGWIFLKSNKICDLKMRLTLKVLPV